MHRNVVAPLAGARFPPITGTLIEHYGPLGNYRRPRLIAGTADLSAYLSNKVKTADEAQRRNNESMLKVSLQQQFGSFRLNVDFQAPPGLVVLFGFSGAGKSLTLRSMAGLLRPEQGYVAIDEHILFDSKAAIDLRPQARRVGYVPQHYALFPHLTVAENILFALPRGSRLAGWGKKRADQNRRVNELLAVLELEGLERRYPSNLSGGQQQRVALARALAAEPRLLLLDEPFNALDAAVRERLRDTLKHFQRHFAVPIVLVTHDHAEVQQLADTVVVIQNGQIEQVGSVREIFLSPRSRDVAQLVSQHNLFGGRAATPPGNQPSTPSTALRLDWLQVTSMQTPTSTAQSDEPDRCWLPLPLASLSPLLPHAAHQRISGCIRPDEVGVHNWPGSVVPPVWTPRGSVQW